MSRDEANGWDALYRDVLVADLPDPELLARYATAPNELSEAERLEVEQAMQRSPIVVDELDTLRGFDFSQLDADRRTAGAGAGASGPMAAIVAWLSPARLATLAGVALALALAVFVIQGREDGSGVDAPRIAQQPAPSAPPVPRDPMTPTPESALPDPMAEPDSAIELAQPETPATPEAPAVPEIEPPVATPRVTPQATPETRLAEQPAPIERPAPSPRVEPRPAPPAPETRPAPGAETQRPEILLAMNMPRYASPFDAAARSFEGLYRSAGDAPEITLLAPAHVARSASREPVLHWHLDRVPADGGFYLTISTDETDVVENRALPAIERPGIQRTTLAQLGIALEPEIEYRWSIAHRSDPEAPPRSFGFGWVRAAQPDESLRARLEAAEAGARPDLFARAGYWYDAVAETVELMNAYPLDDRPREALRALLEQGGVAVDAD